MYLSGPKRELVDSFVNYRTFEEFFFSKRSVTGTLSINTC